MKSKKKIVIIVLVILALVIGTLVTLYFTTEFFKTPEDLFYKYLGKIAKSESDYNYQDMLKDLETANTKSYNANSTIGLELNTNNSTYTSRKTQQTYDQVNKFKVELQQKSLPNQNKLYYNIGIKYDNKDFTNVELVKNGDLYGVRSELLDDKYIVAQNNNLKELAKTLEIDSAAIPDKIEMMDIYKLLYISKDDQEKIVKTYQDVLKKSISSDKYKKVENVIQKVNGTDTNTTVYVLGMNEKDFLNVLIQLLQTLKQDELMQNLIIDKYNMLMNGTGASTGASIYTANTSKLYSTSLTQKSTKTNIKTELTKEDLVEGIENLIEKINDEIEDANETSVKEIVVYVANKETVRVELKSEEQVYMALDTYKAGDRNHLVLSAKQSKYSNDLDKILDVDYKTTKSGDTTNTEGIVTIYSSYNEKTEIKFDVTTKGKVGNGTNENSYKFTFGDDDTVITLTMDSKIEYTDNVQIEDLNDNNATIVNNMNKTELTEFFNKVATKFQKEFQQKVEKLGFMNSSMNNNSNRFYNNYSNSNLINY